MRSFVRDHEQNGQSQKKERKEKSAKTRGPSSVYPGIDNLITIILAVKMWEKGYIYLEFISTYSIAIIYVHWLRLKCHAVNIVILLLHYHALVFLWTVNIVWIYFCTQIRPENKREKERDMGNENDITTR